MSNSPEVHSMPHDLAACEREPIHLASAVEPNGSILVFDERGLALNQASSNTLLMLGVAPETLLRMPLGEVFSEEDANRLVPEPGGDGRRCYVHELRPVFSDAVFDAQVHRQQGLLIIELERSTYRATASAGQDIYVSLTDAMAELEGELPLVHLCQRVAVRIRRVTGFDRVMVYRFLEDDSGSVIGEDKREDLAPYLGLRYPASDIPAQARRLYLSNTLRLKADVSAPSAFLVPAVNPATGKALDMTFCVLRAMSPVHIEYLKNMGVAASMSISIVKDGRLWGLIACHHTEARFVPQPLRITCEVLARVFSSHIAAAEERDERARASALHNLLKSVETNLNVDREVAGAFREMSREISSVIGASGCAFNIRGKTILSGITPNREQVDALFVWLGFYQNEPVFATERLGTVYPDAQKFESLATGLLSVRIVLGGPDVVVWFRPAVVQTVKWGGNPEKPVEETEVGRRMSPRRSFEEWKQTVRDSSESWTGAEREFASALRPLIAEILFLQMNREVLHLNLELARSNIELDSFAYSASHDLLEPVRAIRAYSQLLARKAGPTLTEESRSFITTIEKSAAWMGSLIDSLLSYSQLGGTERRDRQPVNLEQVLAWVLTNLNQQIQETGAMVTHDPLPLVFGDLEHMVQLLQNLVSNAIKYRVPGTAPQVHLSSALEDDYVLLSVRDEGRGFDPQHAQAIFAPFKRLHGREVSGHGVGLATCRRITDLYSGRIWAESDGINRGATFWFTLPRVTEGT